MAQQLQHSWLVERGHTACPLCPCFPRFRASSSKSYFIVVAACFYSPSLTLCSCTSTQPPVAFPHVFFFLYHLHLVSSCPPSPPPPPPQSSTPLPPGASAVIKMEHALGARHATLPVLQHWYSDTDRHQTVNNRQGLGAACGWMCWGNHINNFHSTETMSWSRIYY